MAIHKFTRFIDRGLPLPRFGDGSTSRDYTYISDIVGGIVRSVERVQGYEIINIGGSKATRLQDLIALLEARLGRRPWSRPSRRSRANVTTTWADVAKAHRLLGYDPQVPIEEGLTRFVEWYRKAGEVAPNPSAGGSRAGEAR